MATKTNNKTKKATKKNNNAKKKAEKNKKIHNKMKRNVKNADKIPKPIYELPEITEARKRVREKFAKNIQNGLTRKNKNSKNK